MTKPFSARELVARVHAILRRADARRRRSTPAPRRSATSSSIPRRAACVRTASSLHLTPTEFDLLMYLAARPGRVSTREELLEQVWGYDVPSGARTVDSHVRSIAPQARRRRVRTVHGVGYAVEDEVDA